MKFDHCIITKRLTTEQMHDELRYFVTFLAPTPASKISAQFTFAWGIAVYERGKNWDYLVLTPDELLRKVQELEDAKAGSIGYDDLFLMSEDEQYEIQFCHESDIHFYFKAPSALVQMEKRGGRGLAMLLVN